MKSTIRAAFMVSCAAVPFVAAPAWAQATEEKGAASASSASDDEAGTIVVTGIRGSLSRALDTKRQASGFVDAINAEDVGKLPDSNVAEALQRVTGVSIQRSRGEGDFVSIRGLGPNFVRGTINDRTIVSSTESRDATRSGGAESSTGRETNFDILPAELISNVIVTKSPSASQVEGGIGGVVDVQTHRPLTLGTKIAGSVKGTYRDINKKFDPSASGLASWANADKTLGILVAASYSERTIREDDPDSFGYATFGANIDSDANGTADKIGLSVPFSFNPQSFTETRKRTTVQTSVQWAPTDSDEFILDALYSRRKLNSTGLVSIVGTCCGFLGAVVGNGVTNPDGSIRVPDLTTEGNSATGFSLSSQITNATDVQALTDWMFSTGGKYTKRLDGWTLGLDVNYSKSEGDLNFQRTSLQTLANVPFKLTVANDQLQLTRQPGGPNLSDLASYRTNNADIVERVNRGNELAAAFDVKRELDGGLISALKFGVHYRVRNVDRADRTTFNTNTDQRPALGLGIANTIRFIGTYANGTQAFPFGELLFGDVAAQQAYLKSLNPNASFESKFSASQSFRMKESVIGAYVQADIDGDIGGVPVKGNLGVRAVQTNADVTGFFQPFRIDNDVNNNNLGTIVILDPNISTNTTKNSYVNVLPSLNLSFEPAPKLFLRVAAGRSLTRPTFLQMAPGLSGINPTNRFANSGNPQLKAYISNNFDLGLEYYYGKGSAVYIAGFVKEINNFIGTSTQLNVTRFGVNFNSLSQPANQGKANISGIEAGFQHTFPFGLGFVVNGTLIKSSAEFTSGVNTGKVIPFEGVSDKSYNATVFYENGGFNARLAYSWRSDFVLLSSDVFGNTLKVAPYGQLDASISYSLNDQFTLFGSAVNLTGKPARIYSSVPIQPLSYGYTGRRYEVGARFKF